MGKRELDEREAGVLRPLSAAVRRRVLRRAEQDAGEDVGYEELQRALERCIAEDEADAAARLASKDIARLKAAEWQQAKAKITHLVGQCRKLHRTRAEIARRADAALDRYLGVVRG